MRGRIDRSAEPGAGDWTSMVKTWQMRRVGPKIFMVAAALSAMSADGAANRTASGASFSTPPRSRYSLTIPLDPAAPRRALPPVVGAAGRPIIVIDAGHGGHDPGAHSVDGATREKDVTLTTARAIRDALLKSGRVRVAMTRDDDTFLALQERSEIARALKADVLISVHADAAAATEAAGATVYTLSEVASTAQAGQLAARENKADIINGIDLSQTDSAVSSILIDLAQRETIAASARFAALLKRESTGVPFRQAFHQMAGFVVLKSPDIPAVLLEVGYITNAQDLMRITSASGRDAIATGVARAVVVLVARRTAKR